MEANTRTCSASGAWALCYLKQTSGQLLEFPEFVAHFIVPASSSPRFGHLLVGRTLGLRGTPGPAPRQFCKIRRARLGAARRRGVRPTKLSDIGLRACSHEGLVTQPIPALLEQGGVFHGS